MGTHQQLLDAIVSFAENDERVSALVLVGSQAREKKHADEFSDIDVILVVDDPDPFVSSEEWLDGIGRSHISFLEPTVGGEIERRVLFDGALDVDFVILSRRYAQRVIEGKESTGTLRRGYRILVNKEHLAVPSPTNASTPGYAAPTADRFENTVKDFWYHAVWTTKKLLRGELWATEFCLDSYMKNKLLWMIEQYEHAKHGPRYHTWYGGRFIDSWADPEVRDQLSKTFAHYESSDMARSLIETMNLFRSLAVYVSRAYDYDYPLHADEYATNWVHKMLSETAAE